MTSHYLNFATDTLQPSDIEVLRELIQFHRKQYYELEKPLITDDEFDKLYSLLVA
jgi:NAD-dependent DNA ligase